MEFEKFKIESIPVITNFLMDKKTKKFIYETEFKNVIAKKVGAKDSIVVVSHYDTAVGTPGADDNASGVAATLEIARRIKNYKTNHTIYFIFVTNEEPPFFRTKAMGSYINAKNFKSRNEKIGLVINLESIGYYSQTKNSQSYPPFIGFFYPSTGNFIGVVSNLSSKKYGKMLYNFFKQKNLMPVEFGAMPEFVPGVDFSDHLNYWKFGYKAVMLTDTAFYRNPNYHTLNDTPETLNYEKINNIVYLISEFLQTCELT